MISTTMTNHGDDCYFFYYSTCTKGDTCPFRHCEAAMGNETVCSLWQEGRCFRAVCKFRHMEITKNRKEIPCYWENQPAGCQKPHCAFFHERPRYIEGQFVPPNKSLSKNDEQQHEEAAPSPAAALPTTANPQLRGVIKTETQEPVPSPTHPPVVINPADDDEDEDDQFSEEGDDGRVGSSPRKLPKSGDSPNFGVSTLEEIRRRKALLANMKRAGYPIQSAEMPASGEKENIQSFFQPTLFESRDGPLVFEEIERPRVSVAERLGRKIPNTDVNSVGGVPLKRSLAERLGRVVDAEEPSVPPQKVLKPVKERLGMVSGLSAPTQPADTNVVSKVPEQIRIKTLEEIRQEKATKSQSQKNDSLLTDPEITKTSAVKVTRGTKRAITVKDSPISHVKTFSEILRAKKKKREEQQEQNSISKRTKHTVEKAPSKNQSEPDTAGSAPQAANMVEVRVKTLEEIRKEKAARTPAQQTMNAENKKSSDSEEDAAKRPRLLRIKKLLPQSNETKEKSAEETEKPENPPAAAPETSNNVKVKTFEEIMREKRLRKQELEEQAANSTEVEPPQNQTTAGSLKRKLPAKIILRSPGSSSSPSSPALVPESTQKISGRKMIPLRSRTAVSLNSAAAPDAPAAAVTTVTSVDVKRSASPQQAADTESESKDTKTSAASQAKAVPQGSAAESPTAEKTLKSNQKNSPENTADTKVRPKLNVKPSVMKPAVQVKPGQKRRGAQRSAVAAVKPLNSASTVQEETQQETACMERQALPSFSAEAPLSSAVPRSPTTLRDAGPNSSPSREERQSVFKQSSGQDTKPAAKEACTVPQSPVLKTPTQPKSRRPSMAASRAASAPSTAAASSTSAVDDFDDLINEFTDDHLEDDVDPGIGEDDLLQELSDMIDN